MAEQHRGRLAELEAQYAGYEVYDRDGQKIGSVSDLFVDENDDLKYIGVKPDDLGTRSILIPIDAARVDEGRRVIEVSHPESEVHKGPTFDDGKEITPKFEEKVRSYYGIGSSQSSANGDVDEETIHTEPVEGPVEGSERDPRAVTSGFDEERGESYEPPPSAKHAGATHRDVELRFEGYQVYDRHYEKIGKVDDLFVDESDRPEYIGVKMGFLGTKSTLIPMDVVRVNDKRRLVEVEVDTDTIKEGPTFSDEREITPEFERRVLSYYQVEIAQVSVERSVYGPYYSDATSGEQVDVLPGERAGTHDRLDEWQPEAEMRGANRERGDLRNEEEPGVSSSEEGSRDKPAERQANNLNVRKRRRTDGRPPTEPNMPPN